MSGPLTSAGLRVCAEMCSTCIFRPGNLMRLRPGRVREMVDTSVRNDAAIPCHQTLGDEHAVCRGFFDRYGGATILCRLGHVYGIVEVTP